MTGQAPYRRFSVGVAVLSLAFAWPLFQWFTFALGSYLYSHIILIPAVSVWMVWMRREAWLPALARVVDRVEGQPPPCPSEATRAGRPETAAPGGQAGEFTRVAGAVVCALAAAAALGHALLAQPSPELEPNHRLTWTITAYVLGLVAAGFWFLGGRFMRANVVAIGFLVFMVPMPGWMERATEIALQRGSAEATDLLFALSGLPYLRDGQVFRLPSITMEIAQECSGIHSSLVLFITSIVAGQMFLPAGWRRWTLTLAVIPLALIRNGFRVLTLGVLCERIGPHMIDHWIHHRGGPIFFALSLIPFFLLLLVLAKVRRSTGNR